MPKWLWVCHDGHSTRVRHKDVPGGPLGSETFTRRLDAGPRWSCNRNSKLHCSSHPLEGPLGLSRSPGASCKCKTALPKQAQRSSHFSPPARRHRHPSSVVSVRERLKLRVRPAPAVLRLRLHRHGALLLWPLGGRSSTLLRPPSPPCRNVPWRCSLRRGTAGAGRTRGLSRRGTTELG